MAREFDLFGEPLPRNLGEPGRNEHVATAENVNRVRLLVVANWTMAQIAEEIGLSVPTLRKHYFSTRSIRDAKAHAIREVEGRTLLQLSAEADGGNVSAMKELRKVVEAKRIEDLPTDWGKKVEKKAPAEGKKKRLQRQAKNPGGSWGSILPGEDPVH